MNIKIEFDVIKDEYGVPYLLTHEYYENDEYESGYYVQLENYKLELWEAHYENIEEACTDGLLYMYRSYRDYKLHSGETPTHLNQLIKYRLKHFQQYFYDNEVFRTHMSVGTDYFKQLSYIFYIYDISLKNVFGNKMQFFYDGEEYTTVRELIGKLLQEIQEWEDNAK